MKFSFVDFNDADKYFDGDGAAEWTDIASVIGAMPIFFQGSDQKGKLGSPIFDPKATNAYLCAESQKRGWHVIPVPSGLREFGVDWDAGKRATLAEWQFSNYPFLWNNIIRTEAVVSQGIKLPGLDRVRALIIVTKSGVFPASNSTLYFEQAIAQVGAATKFGTFAIPIRLVGLALPDGITSVQVMWTEYANKRYDRIPKVQTPVTLQVVRQGRERRYGTPNAAFRR